ncbi:MAG: NUDIX domain-containing protein [Cyclobacteriaceae bacterium]
MDSGEYLPHVSVDCVIFGFRDGTLNVLAVRIKGEDGPWGLPGGFVRKEEPLDHAAHRVLTERTGLEDIFLRQFHVFGSMSRNNDEFNTMLFRDGVISAEMLEFLTNRFVSVAYYALVKQQKADINHSPFTQEIRWCNIHNLPELMLDHEEMVEKALSRLRTELNHQPVGLRLLPEKFTMSELQMLYESILGKKLDRRNFSRKIQRFGILKKLDEHRTGVAHKSPRLYSFDKVPYEQALNEGFAQLW